MRLLSLSKSLLSTITTIIIIINIIIIKNVNATSGTVSQYSWENTSDVLTTSGTTMTSRLDLVPYQTNWIVARLDGLIFKVSSIRQSDQSLLNEWDSSGAVSPTFGDMSGLYYNLTTGNYSTYVYYNYISAGSSYARVISYRPSDYSTTVLASGQLNTNNNNPIDDLTITSSGNIYFKNHSSTGTRYVLRNNSLYSTFGGITYDGQGLVGMGITYGSFASMKAVDCGGSIHLIEAYNNQLLDHILEYNGSYIKSYYVGEDAIGNIRTTAGIYNLYCDNDDYLYVVDRNSTRADLIDITQYRYDKYVSGILSEQLTYVDTVTINVSEHSSDINIAGGGSITGVAFGLTSDTNSPFIGYAYLRNTSGNYYVRVISESSSCVCGSWVSDQCVGSLLRKTRTCIPNNCDSTVSYIYFPYCAQQVNETSGIRQQQSEHYSNTTECYSDKVNVGSSAECTMTSTIPIHCNNNTVNVTTSSKIEPSDIKGYGDCTTSPTKVSYSSCIPSYNCNSTQTTCKSALYLNNSYSKTVTDRLLGETVITKVLGSVDQDCYCKQWLLFENGFKTFKVHGFTSVSCNIDCVNQNICLDDSYIAIKNIDCTLSNQTLCTYGCDRKTNACKSSTKAVNDLLLDDPFKQMFTGLSSTFNLGAESKFLIASVSTILLTGLVGAYTMSNVKNKNLETILTSATFLFFIGIFIVFGWIPIWIPILLVILGGVAVLMTRG